MNQNDIQLKLTRDLYYIHKRENPITMNSLVVSSMIYHPENQITIENVKKHARAGFLLTKAKNIKTYVSAEPQNFEINRALLNLGFSVKGDPMNKKTGDASIVLLNERDSILKRLSLGYYVNQIAESFANECITVHAFYLS